MTSLEDAYLELVGRQSSRARTSSADAGMTRHADPRPRAHPARGQPLHEDQAPDVGAPLLETFLYVSVFGAALGSRIHTLHGFRYIVFVIPGLIMMAWAINAFSNNASSILQQKFQKAIEDQLSSPGLPGRAAARFLARRLPARRDRGRDHRDGRRRSSSDLPIAEPLVLIPALVLVGLFFAQAGVFVGTRAEQFDDVALYQQFVLQPLIFLGGVFYSASLLPEPFSTLTHFDPVYYMIALVRYGFLGYRETSIAISFIALAGATAALTAVNF